MQKGYNKNPDKRTKKMQTPLRELSQKGSLQSVEIAATSKRSSQNSKKTVDQHYGLWYASKQQKGKKDMPNPQNVLVFASPYEANQFSEWMKTYKRAKLRQTPNVEAAIGYVRVKDPAFIVLCGSANTTETVRLYYELDKLGLTKGRTYYITTLS